MNILAIDTASLVGSVAVFSDGVLAECSARIRATHSEELLPILEAVLRYARLPLDAVDLFAVGLGPGSFTGVRIGVATAKGLSLATGRPLAGVSSLDALAASAWGVEGLVLATLDARRDEVYAVGHGRAPEGRTTWLAPLHASPEFVGRAVEECAGEARVWVVGDLGDALYSRLTALRPERYRRAPPAFATPLARFVAWEAREGRAVFDEGALEPTYLRPSDAKLPSVVQGGVA